MGGIIGSGWLFAVLATSSRTGPAAFAGWLIGGGITLLIGVCWAELAGMVPRTGASVRYPFHTHGEFAGFLLGWARILSVVTIPAIEAEAVVSALEALGSHAHLVFGLTSVGTFEGSPVTVLTPTGVAIAFVLMVGFFLLNYAGVTVLGRVNAWVTLWKLIVPTATFLALFAVFRAANFVGPGSGGSIAPYGLSAVFLSLPASGIMFAYLGFVQVLDFGGEARRPERDLPRAILYSILLAIAIYTLLQVAFVGAVDWGSAGVPVGDWKGLDASGWSALPLYSAIASNAGPAFAALAVVLLLDAGVSPSGTGWIYLGASARSFFGLARESYLPRSIAGVSPRSKVPWAALVASLGLGAVFLLPLPSWYELVGFISLGTVVTYAVGGPIVAVFRRNAPGLPRSFRVPAYPFLTGTAFALGAVTLYWGGFYLLTWFLVALFAGLVPFFLFAGPTRFRLARGEAYLLGSLTAAGLGALILLGPLYDLGAGMSSPSRAADTLLWSRTSVLPQVAYFGLWAALAGGTLAYLATRAPADARRMFRSAAWLPAWFVGTYALSYVGEFGPTYGGPSAGTPYPGAQVLPFPWGTLVMLTFAAGLFIWSVRAGSGPSDPTELSRGT